MLEHELEDLIQKIQSLKSETRTIEIKSAEKGCPERLYDTYSSFANQDDGGTIVFGLDEKNNFAPVGVYDASDLQKKLMEVGEQMTPIVRPIVTLFNDGKKSFVSAEIPPVDIAERPCFKTAKGRLKGSYIRVGDGDKPMTEYEIYSYEAFRKNIEDDVRTLDDADFSILDEIKIQRFIIQRKEQRQNLAMLDDKRLMELNGITKGGRITMAAVILFGLYPQSSFPQLGIVACRVAGTDMGVTNSDGSRFDDTKRIEGTLPKMLDDARLFVKNNMRFSVKIDHDTGERQNIPEYPIDAVREAILNALIHRDYSKHTQNIPIQIVMFSDRMEITNPGGLYGRMTIDQLGKVQGDTRNPVIVTAMKTLGFAENRYSGIPTILHFCKEAGLKTPEFSDDRGFFKVTFFNQQSDTEKENNLEDLNTQDESMTARLLKFCKTPKTRAEIVEFMEIPSEKYALGKYLDPLVKSGKIILGIPDSPRSRKQTYMTK